jgi:hypothetical protein
MQAIANFRHNFIHNGRSDIEHAVTSVFSLDAAQYAFVLPL